MFLLFIYLFIYLFILFNEALNSYISIGNILMKKNPQGLTNRGQSRTTTHQAGDHTTVTNCDTNPVTICVYMFLKHQHLKIMHLGFLLKIWCGNTVVANALHIIIKLLWH